MDEHPVVDPAALERLRTWGGERLVRQMVRLFLESAVDRLEQIDQGLESGDLEQVERAAHSLKSSAANVGCTRVSRLAQAMEDAAEERTDSVGELKTPLEEAFEAASETLQDLMEESTGDA